MKILGGDWNDIYCRGEIIDFSSAGITTETAWAEMSEVRHFIQKVYPSLEIYYYEEETNGGIYRTNDRKRQFFPQRYVLDDMNGDGPEYYNDVDSLLKAASEVFGKELKTMKELEEIVEESEGYSLHEIEVVDD